MQSSDEQRWARVRLSDSRKGSSRFVDVHLKTLVHTSANAIDLFKTARRIKRSIQVFQNRNALPCEFSCQHTAASIQQLKVLCC
jgi:hypothetical protein